MSTQDKTRAFRALHESGCFVIPNPWDVGSARLLVQLGFKALATTSSGFAWSRGRQDNQVSLTEALAHFREMAASVDVPLNGDFEGGFAVEPDADRHHAVVAVDGEMVHDPHPSRAGLVEISGWVLLVPAL